jgi:hypothetical protein
VAPAIADRGGFSKNQRKKSDSGVKLCARGKIKIEHRFFVALFFGDWMRTMPARS